MTQKYLSSLIDRFLPPHIRSEYETFTLFVKKYLVYLEEEDNLYYYIQEFLKYVDIDKLDTVDDELAIELMIKQYLSSFPLYLTDNVDVKVLIKNAKDFYRVKGAEKSYVFLFRLMDNPDIGFYYPQDDILRMSEPGNYMSDIKRLHDNIYYAFYTYAIKDVQMPLVFVKNIIRAMLHPIGSQFFYFYLILDEISDPYFDSAVPYDSIHALVSDMGKTEDIFNEVQVVFHVDECKFNAVDDAPIIGSWIIFTLNNIGGGVINFRDVENPVDNRKHVYVREDYYSEIL